MKKKEKLPWLKKIGLGGFLFFLIKGLVWILIAIGVVNKCS